jgi:shikimate kinase / 3-dehydroquinate synthase
MDRWIFLSGMMGSGKSSVARLLAEWARVGVIDLDARIAERAGMSIPEIFRAQGEDAFRRMEAEEVRRVALGEPNAIVALGGGTVVNVESRRLLLSRGIVATLRASPAELARRLEGMRDRPLLERGEAAQILAELMAAREGAYAECHGTIETEGRPIGEVAEEVARLAREAPIAVPLGERTYRVEVGAGVSSRLNERLDALGEGMALVVTDANVHRAFAGELASSIEGRRVATVVLPPGEEHKSLASVETIWDRALDAGIDRRAIVIAIGGGVIGDLAGFAAATLLRGVRAVHVPTSLLAMVDSSVGGKTGFDRPQGKNLVGSFHQPAHVLCDIDALATLPDVELHAGLAEVVKAAWIDGESSVAMLERDADAIRARDPAALERAVRMAVRTKAGIVAEDERETGRRALLNFGHTLGHAIEAAKGYRGIRHGEAVAIGMIAAFRIAASLGDGAALDRSERMRALLDRFALPTDVSAVDERALSFVGADKKRAGDKIRYIVPREPGTMEIVPLSIAEIRENLFHGTDDP